MEADLFPQNVVGEDGAEAREAAARRLEIALPGGNIAYIVCFMVT